MRPFLSRCAACNKVDYRFATGVHCMDCKGLVGAFFWYGTSWTDVKRRCLELGISFYNLFGDPFVIAADLDEDAAVIDIMKNLTDKISEEIDKEVFEGLRKASNQ